MSKRDIVLTNVTVVQLLRQPCPGEGGGGVTPGTVRRAVGDHLSPDARPAGERAHQWYPPARSRAGGAGRAAAGQPAGTLPPGAPALDPSCFTLLTTRFGAKCSLWNWWRGPGPRPEGGLCEEG